MRPEHSERTRSIDSMRVYLNAIGKVALLTAEDEVELAKQIEVGLFADQILDGYPTKSDATEEELHQLSDAGNAAFWQMVQANLRLGVANARGIRDSAALQRDDYHQEATQGIMHAVEKFDYAKGFKFSTYATGWIQQSITRLRHREDAAIHLTARANEAIDALRVATNKLTNALGRMPTDDELCTGLKWSALKLAETRQYVTVDKSLDELLDDSDETFGDRMVGRDEPGYEDREPSAAISEDLRQALSDTLDLREQWIIMQRYGLDGQAPMSPELIGEQLGISTGLARALTNRALGKLRQYYESLNLQSEDLAS